MYNELLIPFFLDDQNDKKIVYCYNKTFDLNSEDIDDAINKINEYKSKGYEFLDIRNLSSEKAQAIIYSLIVVISRLRTKQFKVLDKLEHIEDKNEDIFTFFINKEELDEKENRVLGLISNKTFTNVEDNKLVSNLLFELKEIKNEINEKEYGIKLLEELLHKNRV